MVEKITKLDMNVLMYEQNVVQERGIGSNEARWKIVMFVLCLSVTRAQAGTRRVVMTNDGEIKIYGDTHPRQPGVKQD